jgi:hypothetical protein
MLNKGATVKEPEARSREQEAVKNNSSWFYRYARKSEQKKQKEIIPFGSIATRRAVKSEREAGSGEQRAGSREQGAVKNNSFWFYRYAKSSEEGAGSREHEARSKKQGARSEEREARSKE